MTVDEEEQIAGRKRGGLRRTWLAGGVYLPPPGGHVRRGEEDGGGAVRQRGIQRCSGRYKDGVTEANRGGFVLQSEATFDEVEEVICRDRFDKYVAEADLFSSDEKQRLSRRS